MFGAGAVRRCNWHSARTSRIEHGTVAPTVADIRTWCRACGHDDQPVDLVSASRQVEQSSVEQSYAEWRRQQYGGLRRLQESALSLSERTRLFHACSSTHIPGRKRAEAANAEKLRGSRATRAGGAGVLMGVRVGFTGRFCGLT